MPYTMICAIYCLVSTGVCCLVAQGQSFLVRNPQLEIGDFACTNWSPWKEASKHFDFPNFTTKNSESRIALVKM